MTEVEKKIREGDYTDLNANGVAIINNTFWQDFEIAEKFGAIEDTFERCFESWKESIEYMTVLAITLNHKGWQWYVNGDEKMSKLYFSLWEKVDAYILDGEHKNYKEDEVAYYLQATD